jgi:hypothetical protein
MQSIPLLENLSPLRDEPGRVPVVVTARNACFDNVFYDTGNLAATEKAELFAQAAECDEGGMLLVAPVERNQPIEYFSLSHDLLQAHPQIDTVTLPGVGSSLIGTASLARQVANATGRPAVGIVAGYGTADVISEALGGWFVFGIRNRVRALIADWRRQVTGEPADRSDVQLETYRIKSTTFLVDEPESNTLLNIMLRQAPRLRLIVGHSKGSLNIHNVLHAFVKETPLTRADYQDIAIVTLGCGVALPEAFRNVHQYVGSWDLLGKLNTPRSELHDPSLHRVTRRGHNLCSWNPVHMPVEDLLADAMQGARPG